MKAGFIARCGLLLCVAFLISLRINADAIGPDLHDKFTQELELEAIKVPAYNGMKALVSKRYDLAIKLFNAALERRPKGTFAAALYYVRGDAYLGKGEREKARQDYQRAVNFSPKNFLDYYIRGSAYQKKGNYAAALSDLAKAVELSPKSAGALNSLSWLKATCPQRSLRDGAGAVRAAIKACELTRWRDWSLIDTLAAAHAEAGNFEQAVKYEEQAMNMSTSADDRKGTKERLAAYRQRKPWREEAKLTAH
ncbi:MAG: tetratricopeptide repeat protein [Chthoniobacterales bacterium]